MGLFGRKIKPSYGPLDPPDLLSFRMPDLQTLFKDSDISWKIAHHAIELSHSFGEGVWPTLYVLEEILVERLSNEVSESSYAYIFCARIGYALGLLENRSGIAIAGRSESHYWNAVAVYLGSLGPEVRDYRLQIDYCVRAGYFVARTGDSGLNMIMSTLPKFATPETANEAGRKPPTAVTLGMRPRSKRLGIRRPGSSD